VDSGCGDLRLLASIALFCEFQSETPPDLREWHDGPLPVALQQRGGPTLTSDAEGRLSYFAARVGPTLYPIGRRHWRHRPEGFAEVIAPAPGGHTYVVVVHNPLGTDLTVEDAVVRIAHETESLNELVGGMFFPQVAPDHRGHTRRAFWLVFAAASHARTGASIDSASAALMLSRGTSVPPDRHELDRVAAEGSLFEPDPGLVVAVEHDGAALVVDIGSDVPVDSFEPWSRQEPVDPTASLAISEQFQAHTVLVDCFALGMLQRAGLNAIADSFAAMADTKPRLSKVFALDEEFASFKAFVWRHHITEEETANRVLRAYQIRHALDDLLDEVSQDLGHYASQIQTLSSARSSAAVTILTVTLFPLTVLLSVATALVPDDASWWEKCLLFGASVPLALLIGVGILSTMKGYLQFLRDVLSA
jgi:hypothetical protein